MMYMDSPFSDDSERFLTENLRNSQLKYRRHREIRFRIGPPHMVLALAPLFNILSTFLSQKMLSTQTKTAIIIATRLSV